MKTFKQYITEKMEYSRITNTDLKPKSSVVSDKNAQTTTVYKAPEPKVPEPKNWVQSMFRTIVGKPKPEPVKPVQPLPQFDKTQSVMPDMDTMTAREKPVKSLKPKVGSLTVKQTGYPAAKKQDAPIPKARPSDLKPAQTFKQAFAAAKEGSTFEWQGKKYLRKTKK